jgi:uncharacterized protein YrrD
MENQFSPLRLPVKTESGKSLGHVVDITVDPSTHSVIAYHVKSSRLMPNMVESPLIIHHTQVISFDEKEMVVDDAVTRETATNAMPEPTM